ncbi:acetyltransferase [Pelagerythrobacter marensis]|uniref:Acetyltransferase n=1 Tax=Pelagerythrobacter marensis TaxID=543877 RepID=A0ABZ2DAL1_9SPHN
MTKLIGIYGASGFGREVMPTAREQYSDAETEFVFIDDSDSRASCNGYDILSWDKFLDRTAADRSVAIAIADSRTRKILTDRCLQAQIAICEIRSNSISQGDAIKVGEGAILQPFVTLTSNIKIGRSFHANIYSYVAHDCTIGDFVTFAPRVMCNGNIRIEDGAYIGTGAIIRQGTPEKPLVIGAGATVGMGAVVTKDVPPGATVVGNPARIMEKK